MAYRRVTLEHRIQIGALIGIKGIPEIARRLGFHKSTLYREIKRNRDSGAYDSKSANLLYLARYSRCRRRRKIVGRLETSVIEKIKEGWSPDEVSGRFKREGLASISRETVYNFVRSKRCTQIEFYKGLRKFGRMKSGRRSFLKKRPDWMLSIKERPSVVAKRKRFGDWERDTMFGANRKRLIVCLERKSRYIVLDKVIEPYCLNLHEQTRHMLEKTGKAVLTLTNDNGSEFRDGFYFKYPVYYCDPHRPQQRGSVENAIGLLRQYVKRTSNLDEISSDQIKALERRMNLRPRKILNYRTPHEVLFNTQVALAS